MAKKKRRVAAKYNCKRCTREWYKEFNKGEDPPDPPSLSLKFSVPGELPEICIDYDELCPSCTKTVANYVKSISKQLAHKSPKREAKKEEAEASSSEPTQPASLQPPGRTSSAGSTVG